EELLGVLPLVDGLGLVEPLVALQADQLLAERAGQHLGELGLPHPGRALHQDRFLHRGRQVDDRRDGAPGDVLQLREAVDDLVYGFEHAGESTRAAAGKRTLTHGLGQDNQSRAGSRRVRGSDGGSARPPRYGLRIVLAVVLLPQDVAARLVLLLTDGAPLLPGDLPVGGGLLAVRLHLLLLRLALGRLLRRHLPGPDALLDAGVLALLAPVDDAGRREGGREHEGGDDDRESLHGEPLSISAADFEAQRVHWPRGANGLRSP